MLKKIFKLIKKFLFTPAKRARLAGVNMGSSNFIASDFWSTEPYLITIGNHCQITSGVKMHTHSGGGAVRQKYSKFDFFGKVLIGACSVVTKSIPSNVVVGVNPAKIICTIDEYIEKNLKFNLNSKGLSEKRKKELLLNLSEDKFIHKNMMDFRK